MRSSAQPSKANPTKLGSIPGNQPTKNMKLPHNTIEVTKEAAWKLIGNDDESWRDFYNCEQFEMSTYEAFGVRIFAICNFTSPVPTQYYIQDINA